MYIMHKDIPVLDFDLDEGRYQILNDNLIPLQLVGCFKENNENASLQTQLKIHEYNNGIFTRYLAGRMLNLSRENAKKI